MKKLLNGLYEEVEENKSKVRKEGIVSSDFCNICDRKNRENYQLTQNQKKSIEALGNWFFDNEIISFTKVNDYSSQIEIKSKKRLLKGSRTDPDENVFKYIWRVYNTKSPISQEIGKTRGLKTLLRSFVSDNLEFCPHFDPKNYSSIRMERKTSEYGMRAHLIFVGCEECTSLKKNTLCDSLYKEGFLYKFRCPFIDLILKQRLEKMGLSYDVGEKGSPYSIEYIGGSYDYRSDLTYYFRELDILLLTGQWAEKETIKHLSPSLLVTLSSHLNLPDYLEYDTNVLFYNEDGFHLYDKEREVETGIVTICDTIVQDLNKVMDELRGNDHDRTISALDKIGGSLGYVTKNEFSQPGVRIDLVWYDREGNIQVACEVETSSTWKKDLISTWEVEPRLAIIVGFAKTDRVAKNLMSITLMKYVPHPVLYINKLSDKAFLFEKNSLVKGYDLKTLESETGDEIKIL
jgi:hypothetical protein